MKVYLATAFTERDTLAIPYMKKLREAGIEITHDWTVEDQPPGGELRLDTLVQENLALADLDGVRRADCVWILAPKTGGTGCWVEMGYAMGIRVDVFVSGGRRTIFTSLAEKYFETHEDAFQFLVSCK